MHVTQGQRDPAAAFPLVRRRDDTAERRQADRAVAVSAAGLAVTGLVELAIAVLTGSVALLGDALHNLSDVSTSGLVFLGFRVSKRLPSEHHPYGYERAEDIVGLGVALVIWASAALAGVESALKIIHGEGTGYVTVGIVGACLGVVGNQVVARYKLVVGRRIRSNALVVDARHSWLDALSSVGALAGLVAVAFGFRWGDPLAGLAVTLFICHVGWTVTGEVVRRLMDGVDPDIIHRAEAAAAAVAGVEHAHARARWTGRTLHVEIEGWVDPDLTTRLADALGRRVADAVEDAVPEIGSFTWTARAA